MSIMVARAKTVIIATGGAGRLHYQQLPHLQPLRSNSGRTGAGISCGSAAAVPGYDIQYHPTGAAYPSQIFGALVTEKVRSRGRYAGQCGRRGVSCIRWRPATCLRQSHYPGVLRPEERAWPRRLRAKRYLAGYPDDRDDSRRGNHRKENSGYAAYVPELRYRYEKAADPGISDPSLSERRSGDRRRRLYQGNSATCW